MRGGIALLRRLFIPIYRFSIVLHGAVAVIIAVAKQSLRTRMTLFRRHFLPIKRLFMVLRYAYARVIAHAKRILRGGIALLSGGFVLYACFFALALFVQRVALFVK